MAEEAATKAREGAAKLSRDANKQQTGDNKARPARPVFRWHSRQL